MNQARFIPLVSASLRCIAILCLLASALPVEASAKTEDAAKAYVSNIGDQVLKVISDAGKSDEAKLQTLEKLFTKVVDVEWVGRFVLGRHWRTASDEQKTAYQAAYKDFLIKHYTSRFAEYGGETFTLPLARKERDDEFFVRMEIQRPSGQAPVIVDYRLRETAKQFQVFDIIVEGVSLISTQRSEFGSVVGRKGLDVLIAKLKNKTERLQDETRKQLKADKA